MNQIVPVHRRAKLSILRAGAFVMGLTLMEATIAHAVPPDMSNSGTPPQKFGSSSAPAPAPKVVLVGGDNAGTATVIASLPYTDSGNTCSFNDDYPLTCAAGSTTAPDVVYSFTPSADVCVNIDICQSDYDAALYVWQTTVGNQIACNDDACGPTGQQSKISTLQLTGGTTYYIVIDGFGTQPPGSIGCGNYSLSITECLPPCTPLPCPAGAVAEGEPQCGTGYVDQYNGGCNSAPPVFTNISCPTVICGQYGKYCSDPFFCTLFRDTDWYQIVLAQPLTLTLCVQGETPTQIAVVNASTGCASPTIVPGSQAFPVACEQFCEDVPLAAGTYWIFVAPQADASVPPCGSRYVLSVSSPACQATPVERVTWGKVKEQYK
jgi:hypothetical protein